MSGPPHLAAIAVTALLLGSCSGNEPDPADAPDTAVDAGTASPTAVPPSPTSGHEATPPPTSTPAPATPAPTPQPAASARATSPPDSVADEQGAPPPSPEPAADLRGVELTLDDAVTATFELDGAVPDDVASLLWSVELHVDGARAYTLSLQQVGADRAAGVLDWDTNQQTELTGDDVRVDDDRVVLRADLDVVPRAADGFAWTAQTQLDGAWEDRVPADGELREVRR